MKTVDAALNPTHGAMLPTSIPLSEAPKYITMSGWDLQQKYDGARAMLLPDGTWLNRDGNPHGFNLPTMRRSPWKFPVDGEWVDPSRGHGCVCEVCRREPITFWVFDLFTHDAWSVRKRQLKDWVTHSDMDTDYGIIQVRVPETSTSPTSKLIIARTMLDLSTPEGFIFRKQDATYKHGRTKSVLKAKFVHTVDAFVRQVRPDGKEAVELCVLDGNTVVSIGHSSIVGKGDIQFLDVVEVMFRKVSSDFKLIEPRIIRKRDDKQPMACTLSQMLCNMHNWGQEERNRVDWVPWQPPHGSSTS